MLLRDGLAASIALAGLLTVTGPVRTLDVDHTSLAWLGATSWALLVFWTVRLLPDRLGRTFMVVAGIAIALVVLALVIRFGVSPEDVPARIRTAWLVLAAAIIVGGLAALLASRGEVSAPGMSVLILAVIALFVLFDLGVVKRGDSLRDLRLYLLAGERFASGLQPYTLAPLPALLADQSAYPFLYPPVVLPLFGVLAGLPSGVSSTLWVAGSLAAGVAALHMLGVRGVWVVVLILWPPFFEGLWAGNVAVPALVLLAAGFRAGRWLVLGPLLKVQAAIPPLWLLRERRWRELAVGVALAAGLCIVTLPLVGVRAWLDWFAGLRAFQATEQAFPVLYTFALPRVVPYGAFLAIGVASVGWALRARGPHGLARLAVASIVLSPSLYRHGVLAGLPAILVLDSQLVWLILGLPLTWWGLWIGIAIVAAGNTLRLPASPTSVDGHPGLGAPTRRPATMAALERAVPSVQ